MDAKKSAIVILLITVLLLLALETASYLSMTAFGSNTRFLVNFTAQNSIRGRGSYSRLDPHLGYAHGPDDEEVERIRANFTWIDGFIIYKKKGERLERPIVLTLGGSTTDGTLFGHSWPEELALLLARKGIRGTLINGGTGGYSTSQELFKLIRDGLEFKPDIVISYSGVNDCGNMSKLPYPMVHKFQSTLFQAITSGSEPRLFPSTVMLLRSLLPGDNKRLSYTRGVRSSMSLAGQFKRNLELMNAVSRVNAAKFFGFIQPCLNCKPENEPAANAHPFFKQVHAFYKKALPLLTPLPFVKNATKVLDGETNVYQVDDVHLTQKGDKIVAEYVFDAIKPEIVNLQ